MADYQGSEHLEGITDAEKQAKDKAAGTEVADKILGMAKDGVVRMSSGQEFKLSEEKKQELRNEIVKFLDEGIRKFDANGEAGLDEVEWGRLHNEIYQTAERFLVAAELAEKNRIEALQIPNPEFAQESRPGFAKRMVPTEQYEALSQFSRKQKMEMVSALMEQGGEELTQAQQLRIQQVGIFKQILECIISDIKESRTWGEWIHQAGFETGETTESRGRVIAAMSQQLDIIAKNIQKNPNLAISLDADFMKLFSAYQVPDSMLKDPSSPEELQENYIVLLKFLRDRKDYNGARELVEGTLLVDQFKKARDGFDTGEAQRIRDKAYEKINKQITAEVVAQWRDGGMTDEQIEEYKKAMIGDTADKMMNKKIQELNNGRPFSVSGKDSEIQEIYRDMTGAGDWNIADEKWDFIIEEVIINAPLIILSGGIASAVKSGVSAGARAFIMNSPRLMRLCVAAETAAGTGEKIYSVSRFGRNLYRAVKIGGLLVEGATFETVHSLLKGDMSLFSDLPTFAQRVLISSATLGAFHFSGALGKAAGEKLAAITPIIKDKAVAKAVTQLFVQKNFEVATLLAMSAAQHGLYAGNLEDFDWSEEAFHALVTAGALTVAGTVSKPVIEIAGRKFTPYKAIQAEKDAEKVGKALESKKAKPQKPEKKVAEKKEVKKKEVEKKNDPSTVLENTRRWDADPALRRKEANEILEKNGLPPLTPEQMEVVMHLHENVSKGVYQNDLATIRRMRHEMKRAGIDAAQSRVLMEHGILGSDKSPLRTALASREARVIMETLTGEKIAPIIQLLALNSPIDVFTRKPFNSFLERLQFARRFRSQYDEYSRTLRFKRYSAEGAARSLMEEIVANNDNVDISRLRDVDSRGGRPEVDLTAEYLRSLHDLSDSQIAMMKEASGRSEWFNGPSKEVIDFYGNNLFRSPPTESNIYIYKSGREVTLAMDGTNKKFTFLKESDGNAEIMDGAGHIFSVKKGYIDQFNSPTAIEKTATYLLRTAGVAFESFEKLCVLASSCLASLSQFGAVYPVFRNNRLYLKVSPRASLKSDPHQPSDRNFTGEDNKYYEKFKKLKEDGVKEIDETHLAEAGGLPTVSLSLSGGLELRDHHRIWGAQAAGIPILVEVHLYEHSYN